MGIHGHLSPDGKWALVSFGPYLNSEDSALWDVDAGKLVHARLLEPWAMLWISLAFGGNVGREFGFALLRRQK